jgi:hypothetical protein
VRPAQSRTGLHRCVCGRGDTLGLGVADDSDVGNDSLVDSLGCNTSARSLSSDSGTVDSGGRRQDQNSRSGFRSGDQGGLSRRRSGRRQDLSRGRVDGFTTSCDSLVACRDVCHSQPSAEKGGLTVRHDSSRARHKRCDGSGHIDWNSVSQCGCAAICRCACRLDDDRRTGRRVDSTSSSSNSTSPGVDRASRTIEVRWIKGERLGVCRDEWVVS